MNKALFKSDKHDWGTPQELFDKLDEVFHFTLDVCANERNAKCECYFSPADDAFRQDWTGHVCWMNPPYGRDVPKWMQKAFHAGIEPDTTVVCLVPARTDTRWWWDYAANGQVVFLKGRIQFEGADNGARGRSSKAGYSAPFPSAIVVYRRNILYQCHTSYWDWRNEGGEAVFTR